MAGAFGTSKDRLVRVVAFSQIAKQDRLDRDPLVRARIFQLLADRLVEKTRSELAKQPVTDAELEDACAKSPALCRERPSARVSQLVVSTRPEAERLLSSELGARPTEQTFRALVERQSLDPITKARGGDLGLLIEGTVAVEPRVLNAALALKEVGDLSPPVAVGGRWAILMKTGGSAGGMRPRAQLEVALGPTIIEARVTRALDERLERWKKANKVEFPEEEAK